MDALKAWLKIRDVYPEFLFYAQGRKSMAYSTARLIFEQYIAKAGLAHKGYSLHCLRHTYASELLNAGMRIECLQPLLGHSCIEMTRRYARLPSEFLGLGIPAVNAVSAFTAGIPRPRNSEGRTTKSAR